MHTIYSMLKTPQLYSYATMKDLITSAKPEAQQIGALAYATGARVSELNQITKQNVQERKDYLEITCKVLKKRKKEEQDLTRIALVRLDETWLVKPIMELCANKQPNDILVPMYRMKIYRILVEAYSINPHGFRKIRATNLAQLGFSAHQLKHFFGWSTVAPSDYYVKLNTDDLKYGVQE